MAEWHQQVIKYKDFKGNEQLLGTFWISEEGEVDKENLPSNDEIAEMLKVMRYRDLYVESTGNFIKGDDA